MIPGEALADLPVFVASVETGSFAAAAARLNLSRSAAGKTILRLEAKLGVRLFHRTTRSLSLTEDGQAFFEYCQRALVELQAGVAMLESGQREVAGRLRVTMPVLFGRRCVAPVLIRLAERHPRLELDLNFSDRAADLVEDGFDLAIRNGALTSGEGLTARRVAYQTMQVCAAPAYLAARGSPKTLADLSRHSTVLYGRWGRVRSWLFPQPGSSPVEIVPPSRMRFDDLGTILDAVLGGLGLAWLPCWLIRDDVLAGRLATVLDGLPSHVFNSHALWPQTRYLPLRVRMAIDSLAGDLPGMTELRSETAERVAGPSARPPADDAGL